MSIQGGRGFDQVGSQISHPGMIKSPTIKRKDLT